MRTSVRVECGHHPACRPRLVLRLGRAARRPAAARAAGHRRRRGRARRQLRGQGAAACARRWAARWRGGCARTRSWSRRGCPPTRRRARRSSRSSTDTTPLVEGLSIDEAFLDVRGIGRIAGPPMDIAVRLRREVLERVGLPITVGVARTKFLAKVASGVAKPDGLLVVPPGGELAFLHLLPVERLWGVGPVTADKLRDRGITTVGQVARLAETALVAMRRPRGGAQAPRPGPQPRSAAGPGRRPPALDGHAARARPPAAVARGARRLPRRDRRPHRAPAARRPARVPHRRAAPALRRLLARDPVAHAPPRHPADRADPRHGEGAARRRPCRRSSARA